MGALNGRIEASIRVYTCTETDALWTPKSGVFGKSYRYRVWCGSGVPPLLEPSCWMRKGTDRLDLEAMNLAAAALIGEHDYDSFRSANCQAAHAKRSLWYVQAKRIDDHPDLPPDPGAGELIELEVRGNAFCHHQVRIIAGTLVDVGRGKIDAHALPAILQARDRRGAGITAPAQGLTLWRMYDLGDEAASGLPSGWSWPGAPWPQSP
jgi:tRNA pseudouridine38-40 synthase